MKSFSALTVSTILLNIYVICSDAKLYIDNPTLAIFIKKLTSNEQDAASSREFEIPIQLPEKYEIDWIEFSYPGEIFTFNMNISKGSVSGLNKLQILHLNVSSSQPIIEFDILFPQLTFHSEHYELDGNMFHAVPIRGKGKANIEMFNLQIWGTLFIKNSQFLNNGLLLDKFENTALKLERIVSKVDFDHNIDAIVSALVEDPLCDYLNRFNKFIIAKYSDILVQHINKLLEEPDEAS